MDFMVDNYITPYQPWSNDVEFATQFLIRTLPCTILTTDRCEKGRPFRATTASPTGCRTESQPPPSLSERHRCSARRSKSPRTTCIRRPYSPAHHVLRHLSHRVTAVLVPSMALNVVALSPPTTLSVCLISRLTLTWLS